METMCKVKKTFLRYTLKEGLKKVAARLLRAATLEILMTASGTSFWIKTARRTTALQTRKE